MSGPSGLLASPLTTLARRTQEKDLATVLKLAEEEGAEAVVVGVPYSLSGTLGPQGEKVMAFVQALRARSAVPVDTWDERLSTFEAERLLRQAGRKPSREKARADAAAAAVILQSYLDSLRKRMG